MISEWMVDFRVHPDQENGMKRTIAWVSLVCGGMPVLAQGQSAVGQIIHVNTSDTARYLEWAEESMPIIVGDSQLPTFGGVCVPSFGAEEEGDLYVYTFTTNFESALAIDLTSAVPAREIAKIAPHRAIKARDLWSNLRRPADLTINAGDTYSMLMTVTSTNQPDMYLTQIDALEAGLRDAGHGDITFVVSQVMTGAYRNHLNVRLIAPTAERLGAAMDTIRTATWARNMISNLASIRTVAQQMTTNCHSFVVTQ